ncbi:MAG: bifunctional folylpolyglutamate synthase/dihydrofolate synthase [Ruminococcus sp.]|nr:bifunctional folylpolyglutamate synthase/dihydrofolate synthase [Ruminococcus sp.]
MNYLEKIHSLDKFGSRPGLDRITRFLDILGNPQDKLRFIHVAGTNGKGSVCRLLSSVLTDAGYKTGLFISPYIVDFRERIQINNELISEETLKNAVDRTFPLVEKLRDEGCVITEFEYVMALEFLIHSESDCDVVVLETGMGGLLDCTNVINPPLCTVLTKIGLDHTAVLGDTIEQIAAQKCGIIKSGSVVVTSPQRDEAMNVIEKTCSDKNVNLVKSENLDLKVIAEKLTGTELLYNGLELSLKLLGGHQIENAETALAAIEQVRKELSISDENIINGFAETTNPARFELLGENPTVILDGAHNPDGIEALVNSYKKYFGDEKGLLVLGMLADKDSKSSVKLLQGMFDTVFTVPVENPRTLSAEALADECRENFGEVEAFDSVFKAFDKAYSLCEKSGMVLVIAGSLYLAGEIRPKISGKT